MADSKTTKQCKNCSQVFVSWSCLKRIFCSKKCYWENMKGCVSNAKGKKNPNARFNLGVYGTKHNVPWHKGKKGVYSSEQIKRMVENRKNRTSWNKGNKGFLAKEKHYNWVQDRTLLKDDHKDRGGQLSREWSKCVKNRDGWKCKIANGDCSGRMEAHHILGWTEYPELRYQINNGITLCHKHHPRKRAEEKQLSPYFQKLVLEAN